MFTIPDAFAEIADPRRDHATTLHPLVNVLVIAICAMIAGATGFTEMAMFGQTKKAWLSQFLDLTNGVPSHDTFNRVFSLLAPAAFLQALMAWTKALEAATDGQVLAIDGKKLRRSMDTASKKAAIHMVGAWLSANHTALAQLPVDEKSNEITAIPPLLRLLELKGAIVTMDAMGTQKAVAQQIIDQKGDYVLALKDNHPHFYADVIDLLDYAIEHRGDEPLIEPEQAAGPVSTVVQHFEVPLTLAPNDDGGAVDLSAVPLVLVLSTVVDVERSHGRLESRRVWSLSGVDAVLGDRGWAGLSSVARIDSQRSTPKKKSQEWQYYISSLDGMNPHQFGGAVRAHWGIENGLHWVLDMVFREDECRVRKGHAATNLAHLRRAVLTKLRREKSIRVGAQAKQLKAALDEGYLLKVLTA
jgi:predicted transposase YbfD/YdcC